MFDNKILLNSVNNLRYVIIMNAIIYNFITQVASTSEDREVCVVNLVADKRETRTVYYLVRKPVVWWPSNNLEKYDNMTLRFILNT